MRALRLVLLAGVVLTYLAPWGMPIRDGAAPVSGLRIAIMQGERAHRLWTSEGEEILEGERVRSGHLLRSKALVPAAVTVGLAAPLVLALLLVLRAALPARGSASESAWLCWAFAASALLAVLALAGVPAVRPLLTGPLAALAAAVAVVVLSRAERVVTAPPNAA